MSDKGFYAILSALLIGVVGFVIYNQGSKPPEELIGVSQKLQSRDHIPRDADHEPYTTSPATSGPHYNDNGAPTLWGIYTEEVPPEVYVHNLEHGGVVITYRPDLPADQIKKLQDLFAPPYSDDKFKPNKAIVMPRASNTKAIQVVAWTYSLDLNQFDEDKLKRFYLQRVGKAPEPSAGPNNVPINQAMTLPQTQVSPAAPQGAQPLISE